MGATRSGGSCLLELSGGRIHATDFDSSDRKDEEPSERPVQAVHAFAPQGNSNLQRLPGLFVGSQANAATRRTYLRGGLPPRAGFADQSHCARRFRQHVGMSPQDYRRAPLSELAAPLQIPSLGARVVETRNRAGLVAGRKETCLTFLRRF